MQKSTDYQRKKSKSNESAGSIHIFSYRLLNKKMDFLYPKLGKLEKTLKQSRIPIPFEVYVCSMVFFSIIAGVIGLAAGIVISFFIMKRPISGKLGDRPQGNWHIGFFQSLNSTMESAAR